MNRCLSFPCLFATLAAAVALSASSRKQDPNQDTQVSAHPSYHNSPSTEPLPATLEPSEFQENHSAFVAYAVAAGIEQTLYQVPCLCGCDKERGHQSLLDCFTGQHGVRCHTCQKEAIFCFLEHRKGKSTVQIREAVVRGHASKLNLRKQTARLYPQLQGPPK